MTIERMAVITPCTNCSGSMVNGRCHSCGAVSPLRPYRYEVEEEQAKHSAMIQHKWLPWYEAQVAQITLEIMKKAELEPFPND